MEKQKTVIRTIVEAASLWAVMAGLYHFALPAVGIPAEYDTFPLGTSLYLIGCISIVLFNFQAELKSWVPFRDPIVFWTITPSLFLFLAIFYEYLLPHIAIADPAVFSQWQSSAVQADGIVFLIPKSLDILFQQILIVVLVRTLSRAYATLRGVSFAYATCFGLAHLFLATQGYPLLHIIMYAGAAAGSAIVFPYLLLKTRNGIVYTYTLHWAFYIFIAIWARVV